MPAEDIRHPEKQPIVFKRGRKNIKDKKKETKEVGMNLHPRKGVLKKREVSKHQETLSLLSLWQTLEPQRAT